MVPPTFVRSRIFDYRPYFGERGDLRKKKNENVKSFPKKPAKLLSFRGLKLKIFFSSKRKKASQTRVLGFPIVGFLYRSLSSDPGPRQ